VHLLRILSAEEMQAIRMEESNNTNSQVSLFDRQ
jgi:hypothetical protein